MTLKETWNLKHLKEVYVQACYMYMYNVCNIQHFPV